LFLHPKENYSHEVIMSRKHHSTKRTSKHTSRRASRSRSWMMFGVVLVLALLVLIVVYFGQGSSKAATPTATVSVAQSSQPLEISAQEAYAKYQAGVFFLDVREQSEWDTFHIPNTTLIPLEDLPNRLNELPRDQPIVVVCRTGHRSAQGRDILLNAGFTNVVSMTGGLTEWSNQGYPIDGTRP
jgi:rhodanese-related sulfurtransferase